MVNVIVSGVPKGIKLSKFLSYVKNTVFNAPYKEFQINYIVQINTQIKKISFKMSSNDARKAKRFINGFQFVYASCTYPLQCHIESQAEEVSSMNRDSMEDYEPERKIGKYSTSPVRSRSRSPYYSNELKNIELKIELVKKQRLLMEEETKLVLEKRKLEYIQSFGPKDFAKLSKFEEICRRNDANEISEYIGTAQPSKTAFKPLTGSSKLPTFMGPCREINHQMQSIIKHHGGINDENRTILCNLLRTTMKKRFAVLLEGKGYLSTKQIVALYRSNHPKDTDKSLVDELLYTISTSCWPKKNKNKTHNPDSVNDEGQNEDGENPDADANLNETGEISSMKTNQVVNLDEFVDMEDDLENWDEDDIEAKKSQDLNEELNISEDKVDKLLEIEEKDTTKNNNEVLETEQDTVNEIQNIECDTFDVENAKNDTADEEPVLIVDENVINSTQVEETQDVQSLV